LVFLHQFLLVVKQFDLVILVLVLVQDLVQELVLLVFLHQFLQ